MSLAGGSKEAKNSLNINMLAGYAPVPAANWGVVVQRPKELVMGALNSQMMNVLWRSLPIAALTLIIIWVMAYLISKPLRQLARNAGNVNDEDVQKHFTING